MKQQIKVFRIPLAGSPHETKANEWLAENDVDITNVVQTVTLDEHKLLILVVTIFYTSANSGTTHSLL